MTKLCIILIYTNLHSPEQLHIVRYENLKENLGSEMKLMMDFLGLKFDKGSLISEGFCYKVVDKEILNQLYNMGDLGSQGSKGKFL